jgi:hypothetical protein
MIMKHTGPVMNFNTKGHRNGIFHSLNVSICPDTPFFEYHNFWYVGKSGREEYCTHPAEEPSEETVSCYVTIRLVAYNTANDKRQ